jgi:pimeloyl-ACP methyl ester carboxylesterase
MTETRLSIVAGDGTRIAWRARGEGSADGTTLVLTNGLSTTDEFWESLVRALAPDHRVVDWWYRGHGESESAASGDYAIATHADDLRRVTEAACGARKGAAAPVHLAFSMGVTVLLELYRARPDLVGAMVLVAGGADHPYAASRLFRLPFAGAAVRAGLRAAAPVVPRMSPVTRAVTSSRALFPLARAVGAIGEDAPREAVERFFRAVGAMDLGAYWGTLRSLMEAHASDVLARIDVPVLVVAPENDVMALGGDLRALREGIPGAEWMELPHTSHAVLLERGAEIAARVRGFLASKRTTSAR